MRKLAIKTYKELFNKLDNVLVKNLEQMSYHAEAVIKSFIQYYYDDYDPEWYRRTYQFLDSCVRTDVMKEGNKYIVDIYIDHENLHYAIKNTKLVIEWANQGLHGGYDLGQDPRPFWNDAMYVLKEEDKSILVKDFIKFLEQRTGCKAIVR